MNNLQDNEGYCEFLDNEKIYQLLNQLFDLTQDLFDIKRKNPTPRTGKNIGIHHFDTIEFYLDENNKKMGMDVEYSWWQKCKKQTNEILNHADHYIFENATFIAPFLDYFKDNTFEKPIEKMLNFLDIHAQTLSPYINTLKISAEPSLFESAKNDVINEKMRNTHEAYKLTQSLLEKPQESKQGKIKL
jgi:hypothetical protein